jgi:alpha-L-rhamnosidase
MFTDSASSIFSDINLPLVAGMGLHDGGPKHKSKPAGSAEIKGGVCYPSDHIEAGSLMQRDVYILPKNSDGSFKQARQSHFTTHAFRYAELCCTKNPPEGLYALSYRTAFHEWGEFSSSNVRMNGGYELVRNAFNSNLLGVQSDCPHREKIQYGGDINANAPSALHFFDMSAFYRKVVFDWRDQQWDNGAYAGTSYWLALNDYAGIGDGAGETVWATAAPLITVRHFQHYGDLKLIEQTFSSHLKWFDFLRENFDQGMKVKGYDKELKGYVKEGSGLGDWLTFRGRDTWLTHQGFYMAVARCIAYMAKRLGSSLPETQLEEGLALAEHTKEKIARIYLMNANDHFLPPEEAAKNLSPGPEMSIYSKIVPGKKRCTVLRNYFRREGHTWPGSDEMNFIDESPEEVIDEMVKTKEVSKRGDKWAMGWSQWHGFNEGIFAVRYSLKTLSDNGFHNVALGKATGFGVGTWEYMLSHNATTHWESWWRSEDLYSHNHPMLGASAEWMASSVAGVSLLPTTTGGREVLFWPRFPNSAKNLEYASAVSF